MDKLTARPTLLKQANLSLIRRVIRSKKTATRAEIAEETKISSTTVRSLLTEMLQKGELESIGYDESNGGRKAQRYRFSPNRYYGAAFCITDSQAHALLTNVCGEIIETTKLKIEDGNFEQAIENFLDDLLSKREIKAIGIGVPGIVEGGCFWRVNKENREWEKIDIGDVFTRKYGIPVILENDINATAIGFGICYEKEFPCEELKKTNMAYLHFEDGCVSAGFITGGQIIRGFHNFAGEVGLLTMEDGRTLDASILAAVEDTEYVNWIVKIVSWICGILNPQYIALGGPSLREKCIGPIGDGLLVSLPKSMLAEILYAPDVWHDFHEGMAYLTAGKIFDEVQFIKE